MKTHYLLPFLFLVACSSKKDDPTPINPSTQEHTVEVYYTASYLATENGIPTPSAQKNYKPTLTVDLASTPQVDFEKKEMVWSPVSTSNSYTKQVVGKYQGEETITASVFLPTSTPPRVQDYPYDFLTNIIITVDGILQTQDALRLVYQAGLGVDSQKGGYYLTYTLKSSEVVK